jgi:hypothetical protein
VRREKKEEQCAARAVNQTLFEQVFGICMTGGFLYRYNCMTVAVTSKGCNDVYTLHKDKLPASAQVCITPFLTYQKVEGWPVSNRRTAICWGHYCAWQELVTSHAFVRSIFDKVNRIRVQAETTKKKLAEAEAVLPIWGGDLHSVTVSGRYIEASPEYRGYSADHFMTRLKITMTHHHSNRQWECRIRCRDDVCYLWERGESKVTLWP